MVAVSEVDAMIPLFDSAQYNAFIIIVPNEYDEGDCMEFKM